MKCAALLTFALIGVVAGDGAWEQNKEYSYKLVARTLKPSSDLNEKFVGVISRAYLTILPQSDDLLIGQVTHAEFGKVNESLSEEWISDLDNRNLDNWPLNKPFKIHLENGVIRSLSVDNSLTNYEVNQLKVIVSQFQVDTNGQNQIQYNDNQFAEKDNNNAIFKTMEPIVTGNCETTYEISSIPDYLIQTHPEWVPLPELKGTGEFIQISKSRNYDNCHENSEYLLDIAGRKDLNRNGMVQMYVNEDRRIVISGSLDRYTIQSSVTVNKVINAYDNNRLALSDYINVTLESVEEVTQTRIENLGNLKNIGNLVYNYDSHENTPPMKVKLQPRLLSASGGSNNDQAIWSHCWTAFPAASTLCKSEFSPEYMEIDTRGCGFLGLGKQALCRLDFPGCVATPCFSIFISRWELCSRSFGHEYPITQGGFEDCAPGFYRSRCCPKV